ncbi:MAG: hypothetical protein AMXMBFR84_38720 [Candidatus Hydrogenedentota bacterium]
MCTQCTQAPTADDPSNAYRKRFSKRELGWKAIRGYTLMELLVVLTIISILTAGVVPLFQGSITWIRKDRYQRDVVALMKYCQERAVADSREYRFYIDDETNSYWAMRRIASGEDEKAFGRLEEVGGERRTLPEPLKMKKPQAAKDGDRDAYYIAFYPSGSCDYATVEIETAPRKILTIATKGRLGRLTVKEGT